MVGKKILNVWISLKDNQVFKPKYKNYILWILNMCRGKGLKTIGQITGEGKWKYTIPSF